MEEPDEASFKTEGKRVQERSGELRLQAPDPAARANRRLPLPAGVCTYLDLVLLSGILYRLKDVPGTSPPHLQAGHIAPVPPLDQGRCLEGCNTDGDASL